MVTQVVTKENMCYGKRMNKLNNEEKINEILTRGVEDVFVLESLKKKLLSGKPQIVKLGVDPTGPNIHLGRAIPLRKLRDFQRLGHQVVFILGDFTAQIGDPSDKLGKRPMLTKENVLENIKNYKKNVGKILDLKKTKFVYNSKWLAKLNFREIADIAESFTVQQMLARRNFKDRYEKNEEISLREFLYPLLQGYDSVMVKADIEIAGLDQLFNLKAGRVIQKYYGQPEQDVLTYQMLEGTDGRKMSTSWGNVINITDEPNDMFGKIMSLRDELIIKYFTLCTDLSLVEIKKIEQDLVSGANPRDIKMKLAWEIVVMYHNKKEADKARDYFVSVFQKKENPDEAQEIKAVVGEKLMDVLVREKVVSSNSDFRRLVEGGSIKINGEEKITDPFFEILKTCLVKVGKHRFVKIEV